ncbi:MAG: LPS-assembly protein LptD [Lentisphaeria bacterium]|nr:LPS-assembly protein LptD [Lentisphaeria bacterium]
MIQAAAWKKLWLAAMTAITVILPVAGASFSQDLKKLTPDDFKRLYADSWRAVGKNIIIEGNAYLPVSNMEIFADRIVVNMGSGDFEASGHLRIYRWEDGNVNAPLDKIARMERDTDLLVRQVTTSVSPLGERSYTASYSFQTDRITADKVTGNINTSYFTMVNPVVRYATFICKADYGVRTSDGVLTMHNAEVSACSFLESDNGHYSIAASEIKITPHEARFYQLKDADFDIGDSSVLLLNGVVKVYGIPVLWLPVFYKPREENLGLAGFRFGEDSDLGFYLNFYRKIVFPEFPNITAKLMLDFYSDRGLGYGVEAKAVTPESRTDVFVYSIYDNDPYGSEDYDRYRQKVPNARYDFRISNVTHLTPRLDFRGAFDWLSDPYFTRDFFEDRYAQNPQPATYAALEQQFDRFSLSAYARFRVNDFFTTVEKVPELRLDIPRQEIFNTGLYYQSETSAAYMKMKWIDFDGDHPLSAEEEELYQSYYDRLMQGDFRGVRRDLWRRYWSGEGEAYNRLHDYSSFRFDTTHFIYYPVSNRYFSFVPRAGFRVTAYSKTSKRKVYDDDLKGMFNAAHPQSSGEYTFTSYDDDGGSKVRLAAELGFELSTKIHNTWQNIRSEFFQIDGLRHIMQPYVNYTFIPKPTLKRERIYCFDDIDRLTKQNFFRLGVINRLQTRSGNSVKNLLTMENYMDIHLEKDDEFEDHGAFGTFGTTLTMEIFKGLTLDADILLDFSGENEVADTIRHGRNVGKVGLAQDWINMLNLSLTYAPAKNWKFTVGYNYVRPYSYRSVYSMGSTLTKIDAGSYFNQFNDETDEIFFLRVNMPLTPDHRTLGSFEFIYDIPEGSIDKVGFGVVRQFHCWQLTASVSLDREYNDGQWEWEPEYSVSANLTGLNEALDNTQNRVLRDVNASLSSIKF